MSIDNPIPMSAPRSWVVSIAGNHTPLISANNAATQEKVNPTSQCDNTDDETQINAVVVTKSKVQLSTGTFTLGTAIIDIDVDNFHLKGKGIDSTKITQKNAADIATGLGIFGMMIIDGTVGTPIENVLIEDITFDANNTNQVEGEAVICVIRYAKNVTFNRCRFTKAVKQAIYITGSADNIVFKDCIFDGETTTINYGYFYTENTGEAYYIDCKFNGPLTEGQAIYANGGRAFIYGCRTKDVETAFDIRATCRAHIAHCSLDGTTDNPIIIYGDGNIVDDIEIINHHPTDSQNGIYLSDADYNRLSNINFVFPDDAHEITILRIDGGSHNNTIDKCYLKGSALNSHACIVVYFKDTCYANVLINCDILNSRWAILNTSSGTNKLDKCRIATTAVLNDGTNVEMVVMENLEVTGSTGITNYHKDVRHAYAMAVMDLSGAAVSNNIILHTSVACHIKRAILVYPEATSADAGIVIEIGKETDANYYYTGSSEASKAAWYELSVVLLKQDIAAGDTVICSSAGTKTGIGTLLVIIEYTVD